MEKAGLQEALGQKEAAERDLVVQLESLSQQLQRAARQQAELEEENAGLWHQKEAAAAEAQAREAGRRLVPCPLGPHLCGWCCKGFWQLWFSQPGAGAQP